MTDTDFAISDRRKHSRRRSNWPAECFYLNGFCWTTSVVDHSLGGLALENCPRLEVKEVVRLRLKGIGTFPCRVIWVDGMRCGVEFLQEASFADEDVALLVERLHHPLRRHGS